MTTGGAGLCPVLATPQNDIITAQNVDSLAVDTYARTPGTTVKVSCYWEQDYRIQGSNEVTCVRGQWVPDPPTCVPKDGGSGSDNNNNTTTTASTSPDEDTYTTVIILIAVTCVAVVTVLVVVLVTRRFCQTNRYKHVKENSRSGDSLISSPSRSKSLDKNRLGPIGVNKPKLVADPSEPPSLWSVPPSQRYNSLHGNHHLHEQHGRPPGSRGSAPISVQATWRGLATPMEWTYLSVDRLLRDIEASRKNNPNHSWRDFASLSTNHSQRTKKSARL